METPFLKQDTEMSLYGLVVLTTLFRKKSILMLLVTTFLIFINYIESTYTYDFEMDTDYI